MTQASRELISMPLPEDAGPREAGSEEPSVSNDSPASKPGLLRRLLPLIVIAAAMVAVFSTGLHRYLSLSALAENRSTLQGFVQDNLVFAMLTYAALYIAAVVLSVPGAVILTIAGGLLFGWMIGGSLTVLSATAGATGIFLVARTAAGQSLADKAGPFIGKLADGFKQDAFSYMLFLRLAPLFPFWIVNLAPALLGVKLRTYVLATLIGIIPGTFAYSFVGAGLDSVIGAQEAQCAERGADPCTFDLSVQGLLTPEIIAAFALLGVLALIPPIAKRFLGRKTA
ncbi:MAG: TVP38/TMEM64 family protein [Pseudomonadota bacterium]